MFHVASGSNNCYFKGCNCCHGCIVMGAVEPAVDDGAKWCMGLKGKRGEGESMCRQFSAFVIFTYIRIICFSFFASSFKDTIAGIIIIMMNRMKRGRWKEGGGAAGTAIVRYRHQWTQHRRTSGNVESYLCRCGLRIHNKCAKGDKGIRDRRTTTTIATGYRNGGVGEWGTG